MSRGKRDSIPMRVVYKVHDGCHNNASPDVSHCGGSHFDSEREALEHAAKTAKTFNCERRADREDERRIYYAERIEPWTRKNRPPCPTCGNPNYVPRPGVPRPRQLPRYGPPPRYDQPFAKKYYVEVIRDEVPDFKKWEDSRHEQE